MNDKERKYRCQTLVSYLYRETLKNKKVVKNLLIVGADRQNEYLSIDTAAYMAGDEHNMFPSGSYVSRDQSQYFCSVAEYLLAEGDFAAIARKRNNMGP